MLQAYLAFKAQGPLGKLQQVTYFGNKGAIENVTIMKTGTGLFTVQFWTRREIKMNQLPVVNVDVIDDAAWYVAQVGNPVILEANYNRQDWQRSIEFNIKAGRVTAAGVLLADPDIIMIVVAQNNNSGLDGRARQLQSLAGGTARLGPPKQFPECVVTEWTQVE